MSDHQVHDMEGTSLDAWDQMQSKLGERERIILKAIKELCEIQGDATDTETMTHLLQQDPNYVRPRRYDLVNKYKLVGYSQTRVCKLTGATCSAWKILQGGTDEIRKMPEVQGEEVPDETFEDRGTSAAIRNDLS